MYFKLPSELNTIDIHNHLWGRHDGSFAFDPNEADMLLQAADRIGVVKIGVSNPDVGNPPVSKSDVAKRNDCIIQAMQYSSRFIGFVFVEPYMEQAAVDEITRCVVRHGMQGIKLYHQARLTDDCQNLIMQKAAELGVPVLMHAGKCTDALTMARQPNLSNAGDFRRALQKFPDTIFIQAHIGGGGDWQWNLRMLEGLETDNYFIDIGGTVIDAGIIRATVDAVGADRVLFATDGVMDEGVGKLLAARLSYQEMKKICSGNWERIAQRRKC